MMLIPQPKGANLMKLKMLELDLQLPERYDPLDLRTFVSARLCNYGEPLRWAITSVVSAPTNRSLQVLKIEAVILTF